MMRTLFKSQPWLWFMLLALVAQQTNMLTYKLGGANTIPPVFLTYSFFFQTLCNMVLLVFFKTRGFPVVFGKANIVPVLLVTALYMSNETLFVTAFRSGAPYALATAILSVCSLLMIVLFGVAVLKEKLNRVQITGAVVAVIAIVLIRIG